jgi:hypothetical protein
MPVRMTRVYRNGINDLADRGVVRGSRCVSIGYRLRAQAAYDTEVAARTPGPTLRKIGPRSASWMKPARPTDERRTS